MSFYINSQKPNLNYIFNDNNKNLKEMYDIILDDNKIDEFEKEYHELFIDMTKEKYLKILKNKNLLSWFLSCKYYAIRPGFYPTTSPRNKTLNLKATPVYTFFKTANIKFYCKDAIEIIEEFKNNPKCLILLDPPYLACCNDYYNNQNVNIYEYLYRNEIKNMKSKLYLILENMWIIKLLFAGYKFIEYDKTYQTTKKKTTHLLISNILL
jgi:site-specific DNA-adenine methylase